MKKNKINIIFDSILIPIYFGVFIALTISIFSGRSTETAAFSALMLVSLIAMIINILLQEGKISLFDKITVIFESIAALSALILCIIEIDDANLRNTVITIISTLLSGAFTLLGVGLTIKANRLDKKESELKKAKPYVYPISEETLKRISVHERTNSFNKWKADSALLKANDIEAAYRIKSINLSNEDISICAVHGFYVNDHFFYFDFGNVLSKNSNYRIAINLRFKLDEEIKTFQLILYDIFDNEYLADVEFEVRKDGLNSDIIILSTMDIYLSPVQKDAK